MSLIKNLVSLSLAFAAFLPAMAQQKPTPKTSSDTGLTKIDSLKPAIVTAVARPRLKGDTIEYNTEHMQMPPHAVVEELLRRLPGLHVDPDGTITYNGKKIEHLLVDGEDIFGSTPTLVTQNFDASKIARIQIMDRKSEQALFTGIDDGTRTKTINLVLKEDAKNGYFGKIEAGGDLQAYYNADVALAAFKKKEQFTALGLTANTGVITFSSGGGGAFASIAYLNGNADPLGASAGVGIPRFDAAALHYANTWNGPLNHLETNYQFSDYSSRPVTTSVVEQILPDTIYDQYQNANSINKQTQHWVYGTYEWASNDKSAFKLTFHGSRSIAENKYTATGRDSFNDTLVNTSQRSIQDNLSRQNIGGDLAWRISLGKNHERILSASVGGSKVDISTNGYLYSLDQYFQPNGTIQETDTIDQKKIITEHTMGVGTGINFAEPLWKGASLDFSYGYNHSSDNPLQATFNRGNGKYLDIVDSLSSHFQTQTVNHNLSSGFHQHFKQIEFSMGANWTSYNLRQKDLMADTTTKLSQTWLSPSASASYHPDNMTNMAFSYNTFTQQPSVAQLVPAKNNSNPLLIMLGNPNLKPTTNQTFNFDFTHSGAFLINLTLNLTLANSGVTTKTTTDSLGRQIIEPMNVNGGHTGTFNFSIDKNYLGIDFGLRSATTIIKSENYINADLSQNSTYTSQFSVNIRKFVADKYSFDVNSSFTYNYQVSSVNKSAPIKYWAETHQGAVTLYSIKNYQINVNAAYSWQEKTNAFSSNTSILVLNEYISRSFLDNRLSLKFQINNILNANSGISRASHANVITQNSTLILGRFWMLSMVYHFDKKFKQ